MNGKQAVTNQVSTPKMSSVSYYVQSLVIFVTVALYAFGTFSILSVVDRIQPTPYLDEIYHIPQVQQYCHGNFNHWDERITTLPGLYLLSVGILKPLSALTGENMCTTFHIRCTNVVFSTLNFVLFIWLTNSIYFPSKGMKNWKGLLSAINQAIFPPLYFFSFLYYTDMAAMCMVLLMYNLHLNGRNYWSAAVGVIAILVRQTSIAWVALVAVGCLDVSLRQLLLSAKECRNPNLIRSWHQLSAYYQGLKRQCKRSILSIVHLASQLFIAILPFIVVSLLFIAFVWFNDGLVVGDRSAHQATIHVPQLFYFFAIVAISPHFVPFIKPFAALCTRKWWLSISVVAAINLIVHFNTIVHPYLLADNRHYTFYVWKRLFEQRPVGRYLLFPLYMFGAYCVSQTLRHKQSFLFLVTFLACSFISLVPQRLLEIRYFFIPYALVRLHVPPQSGTALIVEFLGFMIVNVVALSLFLFRPFYWPDSSDVQRFMW